MGRLNLSRVVTFEAAGRIRDVRVGPDGYVDLLTDNSDGVIARLELGPPRLPGAIVVTTPVEPLLRNCLAMTAYAARRRGLNRRA